MEDANAGVRTMEAGMFESHMFEFLDHNLQRPLSEFGVRRSLMHTRPFIGEIYGRVDDAAIVGTFLKYFADRRELVPVSNCVSRGAGTISLGNNNGTRVHLHLRPAALKLDIEVCEVHTYFPSMEEIHLADDKVTL